MTPMLRYSREDHPYFDGIVQMFKLNDTLPTPVEAKRSVAEAHGIDVEVAECRVVEVTLADIFEVVVESRGSVGGQKQSFLTTTFKVPGNKAGTDNVRLEAAREQPECCVTIDRLSATHAALLRASRMAV